MNLSGGPFDFLVVFLGGVLMSFTPCIYPILPITVAYIGGSSGNSKIRGLFLSLVYVAGFSTTYAILGLIAVVTGSIFGRFSSHPVVRIIAGLVVILFGVSLWTGRGLRLPVLNLPVKKRPRGYLSCFFLGVTSGFVISPCTAPALGSILTFVALKKNFIYGALILFTFAYGMGLLLILAGTFSSFLTVLPKSGNWMKIIKKVCAVILIIAGVYFVILGSADLAPVDFFAGRFILTQTAYAQGAGAITDGFDFTLKSLDDREITLSEFRDKKPVILAFWTSWCVYCRQELNTLAKLYPKFQSENIEVLLINVQEPAKKVRRVVQRGSFPFPVLLDLYGHVAQDVRLAGIPFFVLIDKAGKIVFMDHRFPHNGYRQLLLGVVSR